MAILNILEFPDPRLRTIAKPVEVVDERIRQLVDDMFETMYDAPGIGLAATQVNVHERVIVIDLSEDHSEPLVFINPELLPLTEELEEMQEGCLRDGYPSRAGPRQSAGARRRGLRHCL